MVPLLALSVGVAFAFAFSVVVPFAAFASSVGVASADPFAGRRNAEKLTFSLAKYHWSFEYGSEPRCTTLSLTFHVAGALPGHPLAPPPPSKGGVAGGANGDSSDEGEKPSKGRGADGDGSDDDDEVVPCEAGEGAWSGVGGTPCETCGRRYPHQHFRALRHGGERERRGSDDEEEDSD